MFPPGRVPHVRLSVHGPKKMGEALPLLFDPKLRCATLLDEIACLFSKNTTQASGRSQMGSFFKYLLTDAAAMFAELIAKGPPW
jgi:hypothetical protein